MKTKNQFIGIAVAASLIFFTNCNKEKLTTPSPEPAAVQVDNPNSTNKTSFGFNVISLRVTSTVTGISQINSNYVITLPGSGIYQTVTYTSSPLTNVSGIVTILGNSTTLFGVTDNTSNTPNSLFNINIATKVATLIGTTVDNFGSPINLQDIERTNNGTIYYAIRATTKDIYMSAPTTIGAPPLTWTLAASLSTTSIVTSPFVGLDVVGNTLVVYGNGNVTVGPFQNTTGQIGFYCRYNILAGGALTNIGNAATNISYVAGPNEDAALLISNDPNINGSLVMIATPSFAGTHYHNPNTNLPYFLINSAANFIPLLPSGLIGLRDYAYF